MSSRSRAAGLRQAADREVAAEHHDRHHREHRQARVEARGRSARTTLIAIAHRAHEDGHGIGLGVEGPTQASTRAGALLGRILKLVYLPISPGFDTRISSITPTCSERSNLLNVSRTDPALLFLLLATTTLLSDLRGQWLPPHVKLTRVPTGACTVSRLSFTPEELSEPAILTTGNGCINTSGAADTGIVSVATLVKPFPSATLSRTV